jgi:hypothetical protein
MAAAGQRRPVTCRDIASTPAAHRRVPRWHCIRLAFQALVGKVFPGCADIDAEGQEGSV